MKVIRTLFAIPAFFVLPAALLLVADLTLFDRQYPTLLEDSAAQILADGDARRDAGVDFADGIREDPALNEWHASADEIGGQIAATDAFADVYVQFSQELADQYRTGRDVQIVDVSAAVAEANLDPELSAAIVERSNADLAALNEDEGLKTARRDFNVVRIGALLAAIVSALALLFAKPRAILASLGFVGGALVGVQALVLQAVRQDEDPSDRIFIELVFSSWWTLTLTMALVAGAFAIGFFAWPALQRAKEGGQASTTYPRATPAVPTPQDAIVDDYIYRGEIYRG